jgi:plasmid stabilization system protein ParE
VTRAWFLSAAVVDVESARDWYNAQRPGLGGEFINAVDDAITAILDFPDAHPVVHRDARRYLLDRFPYGVYYRIEGNGVVVIACLHAARAPERTRRRLRG